MNALKSFGPIKHGDWLHFAVRSLNASVQSGLNVEASVRLVVWMMRLEAKSFEVPGVDRVATLDHRIYL